MKFDQLIERIIREIFPFKNHAENKVRRLVSDLFMFFKKNLYELTILTSKDWCFTQFSTGMAGWLLVIFLIY